MGLLFIMPVSQDEKDRVHINDGTIVLKSYGLPMIFWGYLAALLSVITIMFLIIRGPLFKLMAHEDPINTLLAITVLITLIGIPIVLLGYFFYEKSISKSKDELIITHKLFWIPVRKKIHKLSNKDPLIVAHYLDSPNIAKLRDLDGSRGFQNQGYYQLLAELSNGETIFVDRHARKADLEKIKALLDSF